KKLKGPERWLRPRVPKFPKPPPRAAKPPKGGPRQDLIKRLAGMDAGRSRSRRQTAAKHRRRIGKIRMVENVVNIPAQGKPFLFFDCEILGQGHVQLLEIQAAQSISREIAEFTRGRHGEGSGILQESRCGVQVGTDSG